MTQEICNNGLDDDNNGLIDCYDPSCFNSLDCPAYNLPNTNCLPVSPFGSLIEKDAFFWSSSLNGSFNAILPTNTDYIKITMLGSHSSYSDTTSNLVIFNDEDAIQLVAELDLTSNTSFGIQSYITGTSPDGSQRILRSWKNCPNGNAISSSIIGPNLSSTSTFTQDFIFQIAANTLTINLLNDIVHLPEYSILIEYYSKSNGSMNVLETKTAYFDHSNPTNREAFFIPNFTDKIFLEVKGIDFLYQGIGSYNTVEEGFTDGKLIFDLNTNTKDGIFSTINGSQNMKRSNFCVVNQANSNANFLSTLAIGDISADNPGVQNEVSIFDAKLYIQGDSLIVEHGPFFEQAFDVIYVVNFFQTTSFPTSHICIVEPIGHTKNSTTNNWVTKNFTIPVGSKSLEVYQYGNCTNLNNIINENFLKSYAFIDFVNQHASGYIMYPVNASNSTIFTFKNLPLNGLSTNTNTVVGQLGVFSEGHVAPALYDLAFDIFSSPGELLISNRYGLNVVDHELSGIAVFYIDAIDASIPDSANQVLLLNGVCTYETSNYYCNQGGAAIPSNFPISFYVGNPYIDPSATLVGIQQTGVLLEPGDCETLTHQINLSNYNGIPIEFFTVFGDDGSEVVGGIGNQIGPGLLQNNTIQTNSIYADCNMNNNVQSINVNPSCVALSNQSMSGNAINCLNSSICIDLEVENEINIASYKILKSSKMDDWQLFDNFVATNSLQGLKNYSVIDNHPFIGPNYYKIQQIDFNGQCKESLVLYKDFLNIFNLYPNPTLGKFTLKFKDQNIKDILIKTISGEVKVYKENLFKKEIQFDENLKPGIYFVDVILTSGNQIVFKLIVI